MASKTVDLIATTIQASTVKILIIEDEQSLNQSMVHYLTSQQYLCESVNSFKEAREKITGYDYDCIVLDITLPDGNGLQILKLLKARGKVDGVIIISARDELDDKINGLQLGADDYLTKPFHLSELSVRIASIIRRNKLQGNNKIHFEEITIDTLAITVEVNDTPVVLTKKEYELLLFFVINKNRVHSKNAIAEHLWGDDMDLADSYDFIYSHIKNLRKKLIQSGCNDYIHSVYGIGYKLSLQ
ncbi:response regulator transcription factor [soil metagenome]